MYFFEELWIVVFVGDGTKEDLTSFLDAINVHWENCDNPDYIRVRRANS